MSQVTTSKLQVDAEAILRRLEADGEPVKIEKGGRVVARLVPATARSRLQQPHTSQKTAPETTRLSADDQALLEAMWAKREQLIASIAAKWPVGVSAVDAVREGRRYLSSC